MLAQASQLCRQAKIHVNYWKFLELSDSGILRISKFNGLSQLTENHDVTGLSTYPVYYQLLLSVIYFLSSLQTARTFFSFLPALYLFCFGYNLFILWS